MDSIELNDLLQKIIDSKKCAVLGVFPRDLIPSFHSISRFPSCFIANTDDSHSPGEHWVAFYCLAPNEYEFFDSYGEHPSVYNFPNFSLTYYNTRPIQHLNSNKCGHFSLFFLQARTSGSLFDYIIHSFSHFDLRWNDKIVHKFLLRFQKPKTFYHFHNFTTTPPSVFQKSFTRSKFLNSLKRLKK